MKQIAWTLEAEKGYAVIQCVYNENNDTISTKELHNLTCAHYRKIDLCDAIYVVDIDGYIGSSVNDDIIYAKERGKEIIFHNNYNGNSVI